VIALPPELGASLWASRIEFAVATVHATGAALVELRGRIAGVEAAGGQLKTSADLAAEGFVLGMLEGAFPGERILAEEQFERAGQHWPPSTEYWTVDALDGTRSFVEGYPGFCVQLAYVHAGQPVVAAIAEPVTRVVYAGAVHAGAWRLDEHGAARLSASALSTLASGTRFVDSTHPSEVVGDVYKRIGGRFVECGSVGLKACRVVEGTADVYAKKFTYKLWDVAPCEVLLREVGAVLTTWEGEPITYNAGRTHFPSLLAAGGSVHAAMLAALRGG